MPLSGLKSSFNQLKETIDSELCQDNHVDLKYTLCKVLHELEKQIKEINDRIDDLE